MKLTRLEQKDISSGLRRKNLDHSEYCVECLQETDIRDLNLTTLICTTCKPNTIRLDKQTIEKLLRLKDD